MLEDVESAVGPSRRAFIKRLVIGSAFAAPVVSSFTLTGVQAVLGATGQKTSGAAGFVSSANTTDPGPPSGYPTGVQCFVVLYSNQTTSNIPFEQTFSDGSTSLHLYVPAQAIAEGSHLCVYRGNLDALAPVVPAGETPASAYAAVWNQPPNNTMGPASNLINLDVTDPVTNDGDPIYLLDNSTDQAIATGGAVSGGVWATQSFVDPSRYVVTQVADPDALDGFPSEVACFTLLGTDLDETVNDGSVTLRLQVPASALPQRTRICIYGGDLAALQDDVPSGQTPKSAYAVVWRSPGDTQPDATSDITLTVTDTSASAGDPIYVLDKTTGNATAIGTATVGSWVVTFVVDPGFIVTTQAVSPSTPSAPAASPLSANPQLTG